MYVSAEIIAVVISTIAAVVAVLSGMFAFARFFLSRMDRRFDEVHEEFGRVREEFGRVRDEIAELRTEVHTVAADVVDLKVAVARIDGPTPRLLPAR